LNVLDTGRDLDGDVIEGVEDPMFVFSLMNQATSQVYQLHLSYSEMDVFFRFNPELMNPNKKNERMKWVLERLNPYDEHETQKAVSEGKKDTMRVENEPVGVVPPTVFEDDYKLTQGKLTLHQKREMRQKLEGMLHQRVQRIQEKEDHRKKEFLDWVKNENQKLEEAERKRQEQIAKERKERHDAERAAAQAADVERKRIAELNEKRERNIAEKLKARTERFRQESVASKARLNEEIALKNDENEEYKQTRREQLEQLRQESAEAKDQNRLLEIQRSDNLKIREDRFSEKKRAWLIKFKHAEDKRKRKMKARLEKKQEKIYHAAQARIAVFKELGSLRKEREEVMKFCEENAKAKNLLDDADENLQGDGSINPSRAGSAGSKATATYRLAETRKRNIENKEKERVVKFLRDLAESRKRHQANLDKEEMMKEQKRKEREIRRSTELAKLEKERAHRVRLEKLRQENIARLEMLHLQHQTISSSAAAPGSSS
jgi:hypothetical protein